MSAIMLLVLKKGKRISVECVCNGVWVRVCQSACDMCLYWYV